jgi:hypothetical protein
MDFTAIFAAYYTLYRAEATIPASTDDEYVIALALANEAVSQWEGYANTFWNELWTTAQTNSTGGVVTVTTGTKTYACPTAMQAPGGFIKIVDATGKTVRSYNVVEVDQAQFMDDNSQYAFFTGNPNSGFTLHLNPAPDAAINGLLIDYVYYKQATNFTTGASKTEMSDPYFIVHRMLANRFRTSRNPYYNSALRDAEDSLSTMKLVNDSGSWSNPWKVADNSGSNWGV